MKAAKETPHLTVKEGENRLKLKAIHYENVSSGQVQLGGRGLGIERRN